MSVLDEQEQQDIRLVHPGLYHTLQRRPCDPDDLARAARLQKKRGQRLLRSMLRFLRWLARCRYQLREVHPAQQVVASKKPLVREQPFARALAKDFLWACKQGDHEAVELLLEKDPFLVHEFDDIRLTGLHWACRKAHVRTAELLLDSHADPKAEDVLRRTPEFFAEKAGSSAILNLLYKRTHLSRFTCASYRPVPKQQPDPPQAPAPATPAEEPRLRVASKQQQA